MDGGFLRSDPTQYTIVVITLQAYILLKKLMVSNYIINEVNNNKCS